jgi:apolipoprotein N-acyltransferase
MKRSWRVAVAAIGAGVLTAAALPPWGWWPLAFIGLALLDRLIADQPRWSRLRRGALVSIGCLAPSLIWIASFTLPGYVMAVLFYSAMVGIACAICPPTAPGRWFALPGALVLAEGARSRWPFGGVPVSTYALGQVGGPLASVARVGGPLLLGLVTVLVAIGLASAFERRWRVTALVAAKVAAVLIIAAVAPRSHDVRAITVAAVQGGGEQGTRLGDVDPAVVFQRHLDATALVKTPVDLVVWPEDVIDVDGPLTQTPEGAQVSELARRLRTTLLVGVVEGDVAQPERFHNAQVAFGPDGQAIDRYEKVRRVPFGEYVPLRWLLEPIAGPELSRRDAIAGAGPATLTTPAGKIGVVISWEVFFADRARDAIGNGGQLLINPTNGASFEGRLVQAQQLGSSRLRAIESDRWLVQAAPTGYSAIITPDGRVVQRTDIPEQRVIAGTVQLRSGLTLATRLGDWPAIILSLIGIGFGWLVRLRATSSPAHR